MNNYMWLLFIGTFFSAFSQLLLKQSANKTYKNPIFEYLNWRVILSYGIFAAVLFLNTYAYTKVDMKYGAVIDTFTYVFVMVLSYFILKEKYENKFKAYYTYEKGKNYTFLLIKIENVDLYKNQIKIW